MTDPWYYLTCPACRSRLRIKSDYTHMRGRCPSCGLRIEPPLPKPLKLSDTHEPGLVPEDEQWPEPATLAEEAESGTAATYGVSQGGAPVTAKPKEEEEEPGGVYSLTFDPDAPKGGGISRSAEWEQGQASRPDRPAAPLQSEPKSPESARPASPAAAPVYAELAEDEPPPAPPPPAKAPQEYDTVVDPLFGDVVKVAKPSALPPPAPPPAVVVKLAAPVARLATPTEAVASPVSTSPPSTQKVRKKRPPAEAAPPPESEPEASEEPADSDSYENARHVYRLSVAEENRVKPDAPPKSIFFDNVFDFPWTPGNRLFLFWIVLGMTFLFLLLRFIVMLSAMGSSMGMIGVAGFGMAALWIFVWTFSYACAGMLRTIEYTAAGSRTVHWPDEGWREWFPSLMKVGYFVVIASAIGALFSVLGLGIYGGLVATLFLFPVFIFSGMASPTFWNFLNEDILKGTFLKFPQYLVFYALSLLVMVPSFALVGLAITYHIAFVPLAGIIFAGAWMIYSRLLGRMAYLLQGDPSERPRRRRKKKKPEADAEPPPPAAAPSPPADEPIKMASVPEE